MQDLMRESIEDQTAVCDRHMENPLQEILGGWFCFCGRGWCWCGEELVRTKTGYVCGVGHGRIIPRLNWEAAFRPKMDAAKARSGAAD